ncbi:MAG: phenylacetate--CoA ligase family protein [Nitrospirae bacterium]|nr:phenylacetate--CoA ligase family protein [Nitrospirota bacterium]
MKKNQYLSTSELRSLQEEKLRNIVAHAYKNVRYYRRLFDGAGIRPDDIRTLDDLCKIPITTKKDLQGLKQEEIVSGGADMDKCVVKYTSGSTGQPLKIFLSPGERDYQILLNLRILMENGLRLTDKVAYLINPYRFPKSKFWFQRSGILRREYLSVFDYPEKHAALLMRMKPDVLYGYPSNLTLLALHIKENAINEIRPRLVFSVAEALEPNARKAIDSIMNVSTCDILGTIEIGDIAWQCEARSGYHVSADAALVEFLKDDGRPAGPGEEGKLICTSLYGYTMPLIRYAVNDICVPSDRTCSCGRTLPMMESIKGRANDFIILPDGKVIASCFLVIIMQAFHDVAQYRIVQEDKARLIVSLVKGKDFNARTPDLIRKEIDRITGNALRVDMEILDELPRDKSGKIRTVVSKVIPGMQEKISV